MRSLTVVSYVVSVAFLVFRHATCAVLPTATVTSVPRELLSDRIIGGTVAAPGEFPFFVQWVNAYCGASLIWHDIILSAAQCNTIETNNVIVGGYQANVTTSTLARKITTRKVHPQYNAALYEFDFMVMKLDRAVSTTPVSLNGNKSYPTNKQLLTTIGFGVTDSGETSSVLRKVSVPVVDTQVCKVEYSKDFLNINGTVHLCAGLTGKDACREDGGGPLLDSKNVQVGIVSWGDGCAQLPGVYSRISAAIDWIHQQICALSTNPPKNCPRKVPTARPASAPTASKPTLRAPTTPHRNTTKPTFKPVKPTPKPIKPTSKPIKATSKPGKPTSKPVKLTSKPVKPSSKPFKPVSPVKASPSVKPV